MSCLGKLNTRINNYLEENNYNNTYQAGFKKNSRTSDHLFTLRTLIDKYVKYSKKKGKLFACFVDLLRAFDTCVWRTGLEYKSLQNNIGGYMYNIIKNMYKAPDIKIKIQGCFTYRIHTNIGVKQGCMLSPTSFNIYINDLPEIFDKNCEPPLLQDMPINSLLYADDLILLSQTQKGLQTSLNKLEENCKK